MKDLAKGCFKSLIKDERGVTVSSETLILIVGGAVVASIVIGSITLMLTGESKDGTGGVTGNVTNNINKIMDDIVNVNGGN